MNRLTVTRTGLQLAGLMLVAFNLRAAIAAVSPVLPEIRADLGLSASTAGLLTTLPVLSFAVFAPAAAWLGHRIGLDRAILYACLVITAGTVWRVAGGAVTLLAVTMVIGAAMTVGNVLGPVVVKRDFAARAGPVMGLFTAFLILGAAAAAALTAPLAAVWDWRIALAVWALLAFVAALVWYRATRGRRLPAQSQVEPTRPAVRGLWRNGVAWGITTLMGAQAAAYFAMTAWLPTLLVDEAGVDLGTAGVGQALFQVMGIAGTLLVSVLIRVRSSQVWLAATIALGWAVMPAGLLVWPAGWPLLTLVGGTAQGAGIALALTLVVLRAYDSSVTNGLSAMMQLVGYLIGAGGPVAVGVLYELTGSWVVPRTVVIGLAGSMALSGMIAGRPVTVGGPP
ncbi:MAG TPA: MFS transporter, partial [Jiangellaceae bacterium]|nr:MFS transporter [Jiangellaceae bacterium]